MPCRGTTKPWNGWRPWLRVWSAPGRVHSDSLHGDCHIDQMLITEDDLVLLDLDEMVAGDPALDLAELAVDLGMRVLPSATKDSFLSVLRESYESAGGTLAR